MSCGVRGPFGAPQRGVEVGTAHRTVSGRRVTQRGEQCQRRALALVFGKRPQLGLETLHPLLVFGDPLHRVPRGLDPVHERVERASVVGVMVEDVVRVDTPMGLRADPGDRRRDEVHGKAILGERSTA